jgi:hypothetical protein
LAGNALIHTLLSQLLAYLEISFVTEHPAWFGLRPIIYVLLVEKLALASFDVRKDAAA